MKRIIIIAFILVLISSTVALAESGIKFEPGVFEMRDADDYLPSLRLNFKTDLLTPLDIYDFLEVQYLRAGNFDGELNYTHAIHDLNLLMLNQSSYRLNDLYIALGAKYLLIENSANNSTVLDENYTHSNNQIDIEGYGLPLLIRSEDRLNQYLTLELQGEVVAIGSYNISLEDKDDIAANFRGYGIETTLKFNTHENFAFEVGGFWQRYEFLEDEAISLSEKFIDEQRGLYSGIEITW